VGYGLTRTGCHPNGNFHASFFVSIPLLAYGLGRSFGVEPQAFDLLSILAIGACGALTLTWAEADGLSGGPQFGIGDGAFLIGCIGSAMYPVITKWGLAKSLISQIAAVRTFWSLVIGSIIFAILGFLLEDPEGLTAMTKLDILILLYLSVFSSAITFWLLQSSTHGR
jgi:drug/metabolite transporter (DMT)-like permease